MHAFHGFTLRNEPPRTPPDDGGEEQNSFPRDLLKRLFFFFIAWIIVGSQQLCGSIYCCGTMDQPRGGNTNERKTPPPYPDHIFGDLEKSPKNLKYHAQRSSGGVHHWDCVELVETTAGVDFTVFAATESKLPVLSVHMEWLVDDWQTVNRTELKESGQNGTPSAGPGRKNGKPNSPCKPKTSFVTRSMRSWRTAAGNTRITMSRKRRKPPNLPAGSPQKPRAGLGKRRPDLPDLC